MRPERQKILDEAATWLGTPFHDCAGVKGVGTDCAHFPVAVYHACGFIPSLELPRYSPQFMMNSAQEIYLRLTLENATEVPGPPEPGDFALWKFGRCFSHGAIVVEWPKIIHAHTDNGVSYVDDVMRYPRLTRERNGTWRPVKFFTLFPVTP